jgi:integrase
VIDNMPKRRPPHLQCEKTRHGKTVWYVRLERRGPRVRLRAEFGTAEFYEEYNATLAGLPKQGKKAVAGTLAWLIERYRETPAWLAFSPVTRRKRENILRQVVESAGQESFDRITEAHIAAGRDKRGKTPFQARHFIDAMRGLFAWAKEAGFRKVDPAVGVKYPRLKEGEGFPVWTEEDVAVYERRWPVGTKERLWFDVLSHTGLRRGDAVRLGRQHINRDGEAVIATEKSGHKVDVIIPLYLFPAFSETLRASPTGDLAFICGSNGLPMTKEGFGNAFRKACRAAGIRKSAHGLRKLAATRAADADATIWQLNAMFGWTGTKMAMRYTQASDRKHAAREGFRKLNDARTNCPAPSQKVRDSI